VYQPQPLVLLSNCGDRAAAAQAVAVVELAHTAAKAEAMDGLPAQQAARTGFCVHVLAIAVAPVAAFVQKLQANIPEFVNATAA